MLRDQTFRCSLLATALASGICLSATASELDYQPFYRAEANTLRNGTHVSPHVATSSAGWSVIVWEDDSDENGATQVRMRIFDSSGDPIGSERTVNAVAHLDQRAPRVAISPNSQFIIVGFQDNASGENHVRAARFSWDSSLGDYVKDTPNDLEVSVAAANTVGTPTYQHLDVAINDQGRAVVVWEDDQDGNGVGQIHGAIFDSQAQLKRRRALNGWAAGDQRYPSVDMDASGDFVAAWEEDHGDGGFTYEVYLRAFRADGRENTLPYGSPQGTGLDARQIPAVATGAFNQAKPRVAMAPTGGRFAVAWEERATISSQPRIAAALLTLRRESGAGQWNPNSWQACHDSGKYCVDLFLESFTPTVSSEPGPQFDPELAIHPSTGYATVWTDDTDGNGGLQVRGSRFDDTGLRRFTRTLNPISHFQQERSSIAFLGGDRLLAVWQDNSDSWNHPQVHRRVLDLQGRTPTRAAPVSGAPPDFSIVILPDTQYYTFESVVRQDFSSTWYEAQGRSDVTTPYPDVYMRQANFIVRHAQEANVRTVVHVGDVTNGNRDDEWSLARAAHGRLDGAGISYNVVLGNHDYEIEPKTTVANRFGEISQRASDRFGGFATDHVLPQLPAPVPPVPVNFPTGSLDNYYTTFSSGPGSTADDFLVLNLEFAPTKDAACWAQDVARQHPEKRVIVSTHCYQRNGSYAPCGSAYEMIGLDGRDLARELVDRHSNILMVLSGHVGAENHASLDRPWLPSWHPGREVLQILTDFQFEDLPVVPTQQNPTGLVEYGNGWLRTLRFSPAEGLVHANVHTVLDGDQHVFPGGLARFNRPSLADYRAPDGSQPGGDWTNPSHESHTFTLPYVPEWSATDYEENDTPMAFVDRDVVKGTKTAGAEPTFRHPSLARSDDGDFVVAWEDDLGGDGFTQIHARRFRSDGCEDYRRFTVNSSAHLNQNRPQVYSHPDGRFVVIWEDERTGSYAIRARAYEPQPDGSLLAGPDVQLSAAGVVGRYPSLAGHGSELVASWTGSSTVEARWFSLEALQTGAPPWSRTWSAAVPSPRFSRVATNAAGETLVAHTSWTEIGDVVDAVLLDDTGTELDDYVYFSQWRVDAPPATWLDSQGLGVVVWSEDTALRAMQLSADSSPLVRHTTLPSGGITVRHPAATGLSDGTFAVFWSSGAEQTSSNHRDGEWSEIWGTWYEPLSGGAPNPIPDRADFRVSALRGTPRHTDADKSQCTGGCARVDTFQHTAPTAAISNDREVLVAWEGNLYGNYADPTKNARMYRERRILTRSLHNP